MSNEAIKIKNFIKDKNKKPFIQMIYEIIQCWISEKEIPKHYLTKLLYKKGVDNYLDYMGVKKGNKVLRSFYNSSTAPILKNKLFFSKYLNDNISVKIPKTLGFNFKRFFYDNHSKDKEFLYIKTTKEIINHFANLIDCSPSKSIFVKPIDGMQGSNCFLFTNKNIKSILNKKVIKLY